MKTARIQDPYNGSKVWVIRGYEADEGGGYDWNQEIDGYQFYDEFSPVTEDWMVQVLGRGLVDRALEQLDPEYGMLNAGDSLDVWINQGHREALVLGVIGDQMIVEYEMPAGTTAMLVMNRDESGWAKSVSYKTCPKKWIEAIRKGQAGWSGISQSGQTYDFPSI
jgi:hypothetical protein